MLRFVRKFASGVGWFFMCGACVMGVYVAWELAQIYMEVGELAKATGAVLLGCGFVVAIVRDAFHQVRGCFEKKHRWLVSFAHSKGFGNAFTTAKQSEVTEKFLCEIAAYLGPQGAVSDVVIISVSPVAGGPMEEEYEAS
ncbi:hypothetical protein [Pseudovibrio sp. POLY-S9]|uniref:hypothetical protein n=1 Tax=Pseudovibrio sp. POLY-S9 TaxID=1576596 RepID=UPI00070BAAC4|nr:hypothetical protein [Pseudovibrio sp. POLY-S9]